MPSIEGTISREGKPLGGAYVRLIGPSGEFTAELYTQDDGAFTFHVVDGVWRVEARAAGAQTATKEIEVKGADASVHVDLEAAG